MIIVFFYVKIEFIDVVVCVNWIGKFVVEFEVLNDLFIKFVVVLYDINMV